MKKLLVIISLAIFSLNNQCIAQAIQPEDFIKETSFTKNEKGTVIFNSVVDMFSEFALYDLDDDNIKVVSENPLHIQLFPTTLLEDKDNLSHDQQYHFISAVYNIFIHTPTKELTLEVILKDVLNQKLVDKKYQTKVRINREKALAVLKKYSHATSFDDLVNFDTQNSDNVVGYLHSKVYDEFVHNKKMSAIFAELVRGK